MDVRQALADMVNAADLDTARRLAEQLRGRDLTAAQALAERTYHGSVAQRRGQLVEWCLGWGLDSAARQWPGQPDDPERVAFLERYRTRHLAAIGA